MRVWMVALIALIVAATVGIVAGEGFSFAQDAWGATRDRWIEFAGPAPAAAPTRAVNGEYIDAGHPDPISGF